jgi:hypothetical protein
MLKVSAEDARFLVGSREKAGLFPATVVTSDGSAFHGNQPQKAPGLPQKAPGLAQCHPLFVINSNDFAVPSTFESDSNSYARLLPEKNSDKSNR